MFIAALVKKDPLLEEEESIEDDHGSDSGCSASPEPGDRIPVPEVMECWDPIDRWSETCRWKWKQHEHDNVLEGRAALAAAARMATDPETLDKRALIISDSQVVIGVFSKGRSSAPILNYSAR